MCGSTVPESLGCLKGIKDVKMYTNFSSRACFCLVPKEEKKQEYGVLTKGWVERKWQLIRVDVGG